MTDLLDELGAEHEHQQFGILDEYSKREIRRAILTAVAVPGYQVPFGSREMPVARGWGSGGLQLTLAVISPSDVIKVIDQGDDQGVNAVNLRRLIVQSTKVQETTTASDASIVQSLFGAGREKRIYAVPPYTTVTPLTFEDVPFEVEHTPGASCSQCGSNKTFLVEIPGPASRWVCSDTDWCERNSGKTQ
ncbi:MAG: hypothetical protein EB050_03315 [Actinobacteria bacterium]|nr:hypothetical protein [Actinomycetota bacterium]